MKRREAIKQTAVVATLAGSMSALLNACKSEPRLGWTPQFLNDAESSTISAIVDTVLPATDTPGGLDVKVDMFLDLVFAKLNDEKGQQQIRQSLAELNDRCKAAFGKSFEDLENSQREKFLLAEEESSPKFNPGVWGTPVGEQEPIGFFRSLKSTMVWAYCSSEEIGKNVLNYDPIPGEFVGCVSLDQVGKVWTF